MITRNFDFAEFEQSGTARRHGIKNTIPEQYRANIVALVTEVLQPVRDKLGFPITVTSGYRCPELNAVVNGVARSQHIVGQAADLQCFEGGKFSVARTRALFAALAEMDVDQLLYERSGKSVWVHVSFVSAERNRHIIRDNYVVRGGKKGGFPTGGTEAMQQSAKIG